MMVGGGRQTVVGGWTKAITRFKTPSAKRPNAAVPEAPQHSLGMKRSPLMSNKFVHRGPASAAARAAVNDGTG
jgi:hypothetical protein